MEINHPVGIIAVLLGILTFLGSIYVVVALNVGWRFGYWLSSAAFGGLMIFISIFWILTGLGPQGEAATWVPLAVDDAQLGEVTLDDTTYETPERYPDGPWAPAEEAEGFAPQEADAVGSSLKNCLTAPVEDLEGAQQEMCERAQELLPAEEDLPKVAGQTVAMQPKLIDVRFVVEEGTKLAGTTVVPITRDPRIAEDPDVGEPVGDPFLMVSYFDPGSLRLPAVMSTLIFGLYFAFHLWGLNRAEKQKLSPVAG